ncbi:MAG TPA: VacJ family lipoprotein, partial [Myxococcales bacterium]|nr:VacJ family lipoprotein [Myxococcales bacterium]
MHDSRRCEDAQTPESGRPSPSCVLPALVFGICVLLAVPGRAAEVGSAAEGTGARPPTSLGSESVASVPIDVGPDVGPDLGPGLGASDGALDNLDDFDDFYDFDFDLELENSEIEDPFEPVNRGTLGFNRLLDRFIFDPLTIGYRYLIPEPARKSVNRFFTNVNSTQSLSNDIFQLEWADAGRTLVRLVINSTAGIGGLFDPATAWGLPGHVSDFGQTLTLAGVPTGPYLVLPLFGPSDVRDALGLGVDSLLHPTFFFLPGMDALFFNTSSGFSQRESHYEELKALEESSIDYYSALRSGFMQNREAEIWARREDRRPVETESVSETQP